MAPPRAMAATTGAQAAGSKRQAMLDGELRGTHRRKKNPDSDSCACTYSIEGVASSPLFEGSWACFW